MFFGGSNWKRKALTNPRFGQDAALRCLVMNDASEPGEAVAEVGSSPIPCAKLSDLFYNGTTVIAMLAGRYGLATLALALAGRFAAQRLLPTSVGSLSNDSPTFGALVFATILLGTALSFFPALALGPLAEFFRQ